MALRAIEKLLESADGTSVLGRAQQLARLERRLAFCVGPELAAHCRLANLRNETLLVQVPSGVWAARLRYELPRIIDCMRKSGVMVGRVEVAVAPLREPPAVPRRTISISPESRSVLLRAADSVNYPALRAALKRLAKGGT